MMFFRSTYSIVGRKTCLPSRILNSSYRFSTNISFEVNTTTTNDIPSPIATPESLIIDPLAPEPEDDASNTNRLSTVLASTQLFSRREAERLIRENRVTVAGKRINFPGTVLEPDSLSLIEVDGVPLKPKYQKQFPRIWAIMKLKGEYMVDNNNTPDTKDRALLFQRLRTTTMIQPFKNYPNIKPIYRLDYLTEGLCLLTNSGDLSKFLSSKSLNIKRHYRIRVHGLVSESKLQGLRKGMTIDGKKYEPMEISVQQKSNTITWLNISTTDISAQSIQKQLKHMYIDVLRVLCVGFGDLSIQHCFGDEKNGVVFSEIRLPNTLHAAYLRHLNTFFYKEKDPKKVLAKKNK